MNQQVWHANAAPMEVQGWVTSLPNRFYMTKRGTKKCSVAITIVYVLW